MTGCYTVEKTLHRAKAFKRAVQLFIAADVTDFLYFFRLEIYSTPLLQLCLDVEWFMWILKTWNINHSGKNGLMKYKTRWKFFLKWTLKFLVLLTGRINIIQRDVGCESHDLDLDLKHLMLSMNWKTWKIHLGDFQIIP